jgi:HTH-type transcriptional regulator, sugar sensing transcriptional regulator
MDYRELVNLGLSEKEAKVYLASLELGKAPVQHIAQKANVNRATTYVIIEGLMKKGLMSTYTENKKQFFCAEAPEKLILLFRDQELEIKRKQEYLNGLLPELKSMNSSTNGKPIVRYYEGKEGMRAIAEEFYLTKHDEEARTMYSYDLLQKVFSKSELEDLSNRRKSKGVKVKSIFNDDLQMRKTDAQFIRVPSAYKKITTDLAIFGDKTRIVTLEGKLLGLIIENKEISKTFKILFDLAWEYLKLCQKSERGPKK